MSVHIVQVTMYMIVQMNNCYHSPHTLINGWTVKTNQPSNTAFRGYGAPQSVFIIEAILDHIGSYMNIAPEKVNSIYKFICPCTHRELSDQTRRSLNFIFK